MPIPCNKEIFEKGTPLMLVNTWWPEDNPIRADGMESWVQLIARESNQRLDYHYSGGIAQVLYIGDRSVILETIAIRPCPGQVLKIFREQAEGLYRSGVTSVPEDSLGGFWDGDNRSTII